MARGDGRAWERWPGGWYVAYYGPVDGHWKEIREAAGKTEAEALKLLKKRITQVSAHRAGYAKFQSPRQQRITVNELLDDLVRDYHIRGLHSSVAGLPYLREFFGTMRAINVTTDRIRSYIVWRQKLETATATINRQLTSLGQALRLGVESGALSSVPKIPKLREDNARQGFFERAELDALLANLPDADIRDFVEWLGWTGMRKGEAASLTWEGFDRETWTLRLHARNAKTGYGRVVALEGRLRDIIENRLRARRLDTSLIFHREGKPILDFRCMWWRACKKAGLSNRLVHDLRRTAVRNMIRAGVAERVAMEISGHRTRAVFDRYNITSTDDLRQAVLKTTAYVSSL